MTSMDRLWEASWQGDLSAMQSAIAEDADPKGTRDGSSPLEPAVYNGKVEACRLLLELGADPNFTSEGTGETLLHQAITGRNVTQTEVALALIDAGADPNRRTRPDVTTLCFARDIRTRAETPLHRAAAFGNAALIRALVEAGADRMVKDRNGDSPLTWASWHLRDNEILKLLLYGEFAGSLP